MGFAKGKNKITVNISYGNNSPRTIGTFSNMKHAEYILNKVKSYLPDYKGDLGRGRKKGEGARYPKSDGYYKEKFETAVKEAVAAAQRELGDEFTKTATVSLANLKDISVCAPKTSSVEGVSYVKRRKKWRVGFRYERTPYHFGSVYDTEEQAVKALTIAKREFLNFKGYFKGTPSKAGLDTRCAEVRAIAIETVMGNIHDGQGWKCVCGLDHSGEKKKCLIVPKGKRGFSKKKGCGRWKGGVMPPKKFKKRKKTVHVPAHKTSASYPKKIKTVLEAGGLSTSDIEQKIHEVYHDDDLLNKEVFCNTLKDMVEHNQLVKDGDVYSLPGSSDTTTTNRNEPKAKKYKKLEIDVDDASFNSDMLVDESEDEGEEEEDGDDNLTEESYDSEDSIDVYYIKAEAERAMKRKQANNNDREARAKRRRDGIPITPLPKPVKKKKKAVRKVEEEEEVPDPPLSEYELLRLGKIRRNKERLASLGLGQGTKKLQ